jgi:glycine betaine/proline transport system permease protein
MTAAAASAVVRPGFGWTRARMHLVVAVAVVFGTLLLSRPLPWLAYWPEPWVVPLKLWITDFFKWLGNDLDFGLFTFRDLTRAVSWLLGWPLAWTEAILFEGFRDLGIAQIPWITVVAGVGILGHWIKGFRLALFASACTLYLAIFNLWTDSMQTLALVIVTVPLAALLGLGLGIAATRSRRVESVLTACFDIMQATPHLAYLGPVVVLFGFGQVPAMLATVIFAMPPMARCVILGIRTVPADVIESGRMSGCTPRQLLWKVELPAANRTLMLGLNQAVMQTLAMVVIASLVGASGLGQKLLFSLQQLYVGKAIEQGIAIVLIAIVLDRLSHAYAYRALTRSPAGASFWRRHRHMVLFFAVLAVGILAAVVMPELRTLPKQFTITFGPVVDVTVRWVSKNLYPYVMPARDAITVYLLLPLRNVCLWLPWSTLTAAVVVLGWYHGGGRIAALSASLLAVILLSGFWVPAMMTVYLVSAAVLICIIIGVPIGIWAARSDRVARVIMAVCDTLQTFPSFIYLIPVIMLLKVGDLSNIIAILAYASVPAIRFTYLGLKRIPAVTIEAARAAGCTPRQRLWKVEMPMALPEIMLGINQTIMMALAMTAITALIGSRDLGQEIYKALPGADTGRGILAGLGIAFIGIIADRIIGSWANRRKRQLGLA